jgi:hypothetical protein
VRHPLGVGHRRHRSSAAPLGSSNRRSTLVASAAGRTRIDPCRPASAKNRCSACCSAPTRIPRQYWRFSPKGVRLWNRRSQVRILSGALQKFRLRRGIRAGAERPVVAAEPRRAPAVRRLADEPARTQRTSERPLGRERADAAARRTRRRRGRGSPRAECGRAFEFKERRVTREELARLLNEIPPKWRPLFDLLAETGLRISEAPGLLERPRARLGRAAAASQPRGSSRGGRSPEVPSRGANRAAAVWALDSARPLVAESESAGCRSRVTPGHGIRWPP